MSCVASLKRRQARQSARPRPDQRSLNKESVFAHDEIAGRVFFEDLFAVDGGVAGEDHVLIGERVSGVVVACCQLDPPAALEVGALAEKRDWPAAINALRDEFSESLVCVAKRLLVLGQSFLPGRYENQPRASAIG